MGGLQEICWWQIRRAGESKVGKPLRVDKKQNGEAYFYIGGYRIVNIYSPWRCMWQNKRTRKGSGPGRDDSDISKVFCLRCTETTDSFKVKIDLCQGSYGPRITLHPVARWWVGSVPLCPPVGSLWALGLYSLPLGLP